MQIKYRGSSGRRFTHPNLDGTIDLNAPNKVARLKLLVTILFAVAFATVACGPSFKLNNREFSSMHPDRSGGMPAPAPVASPDKLYAASAYGRSEFRRLTRYELQNSLQQIFKVNPSSALLDLLPADYSVTTYFDNEASTQSVTDEIVKAFGQFAEGYAAQLKSSPNLVRTLAACTPASADDRNCFRQFATRVGRMILRRPVAASTADRWADVFLPYAVQDGNFMTAIELVLTSMLLNPEFLYRIEGGTMSLQNPGLKELSDHEIATRISFLITGTAPDSALLDAADSGRLRDESERVMHAERLLNTARARTHLTRFHAEWLGFAHRVLSNPLASDMNQESSKLVEAVAFGTDREWMELYTAKETYLTPALATHYGVSGVTTPGWVAYTGGRGGGILSHATLMSLGTKFGDTSPTLRGYEIYKRVQCGRIGQVPPGVDTDNPPGQPGECKDKAYYMRSNPACVSCHTITDNIGFGLENLSPFGQWRATEPGKPSCGITGQGSYQGTSFNGPTQLGELFANHPATSACATRQLFRFMTGRLEESGDEATLAALNAEYLTTKKLASLITAMVRTSAIMYRNGSPK